MNSTRELPPPFLRRRARRLEKKSAVPLPPMGEGFFPILDPLTVKELNGLSRHWQSYVGRVIYVAIVAAVLLRWWSEMAGNPGLFSSSEFAVFGRTLFRILAPGQMALVTLAAISAGSDMITKEVRSGTLNLLHLASLSHSGIVMSKWKAVMLSATTLILSGLPTLAICNYIGGVGPYELLWSFTLTWTMAAVGAALSIRYSAASHGPLIPILKSTGLILGSALVVLPFAAGAYPLFILAACIHPVYGAVGALIGRPEEWELYAWIGSAAFAFALSMHLLRSAALRVRARVIDPPPPPRPLNDPELFESNYRRLSLRGPRVCTVQRRIWNRYEHLWKEWMTRPATRLPLDARVTIAIVTGLLMLAVWICSFDGAVLEPFYFVGMIFLMLAALNGAVLFRGDALKIDMILSTPVSTRSILFTKLFAGLCSPEALWGFALAWGAVFLWFHSAGSQACAVVGLGSTLYLVFAFGLGAAASLCSRNVRSAMLICVGILGLLAIGVPWVTSTLIPLGGGASSLLARAADAIAVTRFLEGFRLSTEQRMAGTTFDVHEGLARAAGFCALYAALIVSLVAAIFLRFRRLSGRS